MNSEAVLFIKNYISEVLRVRDVFSIVLSGGQVLQSLYRALFYIDVIPWEKMHFFITDEFCLPHGNNNSNFKNTVNSLLRRTNIPLQNIHWINTDIVPLKRAASEYEKTLKQYLSQHDNLFDLLLLSLGPDGHIASIFPGFSSVLEKSKLVVLTEKAILDPRVQRITMTLPALNKSRKVMYFLSDENCSALINEIIYRKKEDKFAYPVELIKATEGEHIWFILRSRL